MAGARQLAACIDLFLIAASKPRTPQNVALVLEGLEDAERLDGVSVDKAIAHYPAATFPLEQVPTPLSPHAWQEN
jgi:hypothetical protein